MLKGGADPRFRPVKHLASSDNLWLWMSNSRISQAVVALADTLHFGRAADRLHVSQPALSKRLRKLEGRIGGPLLVRGYRDVRLTEAGRLLADRGRLLLRESEAAVALSQQAARGEAGPAARSGSGSPASSACCPTCCCASAAPIRPCSCS